MASVAALADVTELPYRFQRWTYAAPPTVYDLADDSSLLGWVRRGVQFLCGAGLRYYNHLRVLGRDNVPPRGACIFAPNHASHLDPLAVAAALPGGEAKDLCAAAAADYFFRGTWLRRIANLFVHCIPVDRTGVNRRGLRLCISKLREGKRLIVFPEGTRAGTAKPNAFKPGVVMLGRCLKVPVLPTCILGAEQSLGRSHIIPRRVEIAVAFGRPMRFWEPPLSRLPHLSAAKRLRDRVDAMKDDIENTEGQL